MKNSYGDLLREAQSMGLQVVEGTITGDHLGHYDHERRLITIDGRINDNQKRVALQHEIIHAEHFRLGMNRWMDPVAEEAKTRRETALRLVDLREYAQAEQTYEACPFKIANELHVTVGVIKDIQDILENEPFRRNPAYAY
ncbi:hypothetical protein JS533_005155 [Bifidobacterium amazonense]|uniref:IrrE N-terminal-like domain-containing protein n=1 Tax=Bifidobacterium amazonense TaxID=2809027 RepID=A0ABS9VUL6_9BIFI|nr:hypothetical protein [Bifidobacterium amazonense]MCH9275661.1 hypothetical protein [Bifidobacterium amazonense]